MSKQIYSEKKNYWLIPLHLHRNKKSTRLKYMKKKLFKIENLKFNTITSAKKYYHKFFGDTFFQNNII